LVYPKHHESRASGAVPTNEDALTAASQPYLPIARVQALFGRQAPALPDMLFRLIEASLHLQG
jgi:hypothetical protein